MDVEQITQDLKIFFQSKAAKERAETETLKRNRNSASQFLDVAETSLPKLEEAFKANERDIEIKRSNDLVSIVIKHNDEIEYAANLSAESDREGVKAYINQTYGFDGQLVDRYPEQLAIDFMLDLESQIFREVIKKYKATLE